MDVLVTGGTGFIGQHLCEILLDRGHDVTALARDPEDASLPHDVGTQSCDITEYEGLPDVIEGADAIVHLVALSPLFRPPNGESMHEHVHVQGTRNVVRAMEEVGVDRLVHMSGLGADPDGPTAFIRAKGRAEGIVSTADLDATIARPTAVFGDGGEFIEFIKLVTTPYLTGLPGGGRMKFQPIWVEDVARLLAEMTTRDKHIGEAYEIGGPDVMTLAEITKQVYSSEGRSVRILPVPMPIAGLGLTLAGPVPLVPFGRDQYRALQLDNTLEENHVIALGFEESDLRQLETYLEERARS